ncbi:hypothetical protein CRG98_026593 [Punica granatum]|uniref:Uncharacterized protein n=1 Tax=Punica granatum TaxID=22663 RepID=A0A2I0JAK3_PUNGR|nr:hypothetical protein CRG98_026593 [Punica granatum]
MISSNQLVPFEQLYVMDHPRAQELEARKSPTWACATNPDPSSSNQGTSNPWFNEPEGSRVPRSRFVLGSRTQAKESRATCSSNHGLGALGL